MTRQLNLSVKTADKIYMKNALMMPFGLTAMALFLMGCNGNITEYVKGVQPPQITQPSSEPPVSNEPMTIKVAPGVFSGSSNNVAIKASVTATDRLYPAGDISAKLTISRSRVTP